MERKTTEKLHTPNRDCRTTYKRFRPKKSLLQVKKKQKNNQQSFNLQLNNKENKEREERRWRF